jgi:HAD superfamily hydrolase (TIGR01549 family)
MTRQVLVFDLDDTLLDVSKRRALAREMVGATAGSAGGAISSEIRSLVRKFIELPELLEFDEPHDEILRVLREFQSQNKYNLVIYTARQNHRLLLAQLSKLGLDEFFKDIFSTSGKPKSKTDLNSRLSGASVRAYFGDSNEDCEVAKSIQCPFYWVCIGNHQSMHKDQDHAMDVKSYQGLSFYLP